MAHIRLRYVHAVRGRDGKVRRYFRRRGIAPVPLPGLPGSVEFNEAYAAALSGQAPPQPIGSSRAKPGTIDMVVASYMVSAAFVGLAPTTRRVRRHILERFRIDHGDKRVATLQRQHIERMIAAKATSSTALHLLLVIRELMRFAVKIGMRPDDPSQGIKRPRINPNAGLYTWTEDDIAKYMAKHPVGTRARLAMALGLYTGQRRSDVVRMGPQHVRDGVIAIKQSKTATALLIPVHPDLQVLLDAAPGNQLVFLTTRSDLPFTPDTFSMWFKDQCRKAGLPSHATFHGLRKAAARRLAEAGCSANVIAAVTGHKSLREVARYTAAADQLRMARQGIDAMRRTTDDR